MAGPEPEFETVDPTFRRIAIAENLNKSLATKVLVATAVCVDLTYFFEYKDISKKRLELQFGAPFRIEIFMLRAMAQALKEYPALNSWFVTMPTDPPAYQIRMYKNINIGLAFADEKGLIVPVVKDADQKDDAVLAKEIERLYQGAKNGKLPPRDYKNGTITFNNPGALGGVDGFSIPPPEQSAIVSLHRMEEVQRFRYGWRNEAKLSLVFDHQVCDGREALGFLNSIKSYFESEKYKPPHS